MGNAGIINIFYISILTGSAVQIIECDNAHLVSKAGSVISSKSPSRAFRWSGIYYTEFNDKPRNIVFIIADELHSILNSILHSLSANYGSVY